jgi:hypothetical protein
MRSLLLILNRLRIKEAFFSRFKGAEPKDVKEVVIKDDNFFRV